MRIIRLAAIGLFTCAIALLVPQTRMQIQALYCADQVAIDWTCLDSDITRLDGDGHRLAALVSRLDEFDHLERLTLYLNGGQAVPAGMSASTSLESLKIDGDGGPVNMAALAEMAGLVRLSLRNVETMNFPILDHLPELDLWDATGDIYDVMPAMEGLEAISIVEAPEDVSFEEDLGYFAPLRRLQRLSILGADGTPPLTSLEGLRNSGDLNVLVLTMAFVGADLEPLANLELQTLSILGGRDAGPISLGALDAMQSLKLLHLANVAISDFPSDIDLAKLVLWDVDDLTTGGGAATNSVGEVMINEGDSLALLGRFETATAVHLFSIAEPDVSVLQGIEVLELNIAWAETTDLSPLAGHPTLQKLFVEGDVTGIDAVRAIPDLASLAIYGGDTEIFAEFPAELAEYLASQ